MSEENTEPQNNNESSEEVKSTEDIFYSKDSEAKTDEVATEDTEVKESEEVEAKEETTDKEEESTKEDTKEGAPEKYELEYDDSLTDEQIEGLEAYAKDLDLTTEKAQQFVKFQQDLITKHTDAQTSLHNKTVDGWAEEIKSDKEFGLTNIKESAQFAKTVVNKFGGADFEAMLNDSGYGNHPLLFKTFARIGKAMANDKLVTGAVESKPSKTTEEIFYPSNF